MNGLVDERFMGFGDLGSIKTAVIDVSGMTRMTSFGVRQWLRAMDALPKTITDAYLLACPTFFVYQLNMVLNFGGSAKVITVVAPYTCMSCGVESSEAIDVISEHASLVQGQVAEKECRRCAGKLELDETAESYFAFVSKYGASTLGPGAAQMLAASGLYTARLVTENDIEKPPKIIKLVHGNVTYFRISGTIGSTFRSRPFLVGAEGEIVIDLADVERFDPAGTKEWRRLLKSLSTQVPCVTLVDIGESFLVNAGDSLTGAKNIAVPSVLLSYGCIDCFRTSFESVSTTWPIELGSQICTACGGRTGSKTPSDLLAPLAKIATKVPPESARVIAHREEILSRAMIDASVAQAGERATPAIGADDTILGKYKIVRRLSAGGMAEVFLAKQVGIGGFEKPVALKRIQRKLLDNRQQAVELFLNEAKIAGRLVHPNIVQVLDVGEVDGALYLAMEYVHGKDVNDMLKKLYNARLIMPMAQALHVVREVAQALHHAYWSSDMTGKRLSVVHRDVSPANIIVGFDGTVKLIDFGVAMSAVTDHQKKIVVGKWLYMAPEATSDQQLDHRSDLFSLGVVLYLLCTGYMPFTGRDPKEIVKKMRGSQYKPLHEIVSVPERLSVLVSRLLAPNPDDRPQRGNEVVSELTEIARQNGFESTTAQLSELVVQVFPEEAGGQGPPPLAVQSVDEIVVSAEPHLSRTTSRGEATSPVPTRTTNQGIGIASTRDMGMGSTSPRPAPPAPELPTQNRWLLIVIVVVIATAIGLFVVFGPL
ncbi:MAG: serine/threonine protein kinase [Myxococcota bacterium]|nr:serine/threonine protein kinase [Myxococcota bacterium]